MIAGGGEYSLPPLNSLMSSPSSSQPGFSLSKHLMDLPALGGKAYVISLGCPKNLVDTERYVSMLRAKGYSLADNPEEAEILFINTCSFIDKAKQESIDTILEVADEKRDDQTLVVAGCLVDRYRSELVKEIPEVDLWGDLNTFAQFAEDLATIRPAVNPPGFVPIPTLPVNEPLIPWAGQQRVVLTPRHTTYLKISEGCDHTCGFCAIPSFKGKHRSVPMETLVAEARALAETGAREITLIGQDTVAYGKDLGDRNRINLRALIEGIHEVEGIEWIRVLYTYPTRLADELEWAYGNLPKFIPYLDLPLQHLSDPVLTRMRRGTPYESIREHVARLRRTAPNLVVRSTCIVGFPGETEGDFHVLPERFRELQVDHLGVFRYSDEEGTPAMGLDARVPQDIAEERWAWMSNWAAAHCQQRAEKRIGEVHSVLVDGPARQPEAFALEVEGEVPWWQGRWYGQAPEIDGVVYFQANEVAPGMFVRVRFEDTVYPDYLGILA